MIDRYNRGALVAVFAAALVAAQPPSSYSAEPAGQSGSAGTRGELQGFAHVIRQLDTAHNALKLDPNDVPRQDVHRRLQQSLAAAHTKLDTLATPEAQQARTSLRQALDLLTKPDPSKMRLLAMTSQAVDDFKMVHAKLARLPQSRGGENTSNAENTPQRAAPAPFGDGSVAHMGEALDGLPVHSRDGTLLGNVEEVIIGPSGQVQSVGIVIGGFIGIAARRIGLSADDLTFRDGRLTARQSHDDIHRLAR